MREEIKKQYSTTEEFCNEAEIDHTIVYRLLSGERPDIKVSTLYRIAKGLNKRPVVKME